MTASTTTTRDSLYIGGKWVPSSGSGSIEVIDSTTEEVIGTVPEGTPADVDAAVAAARAALPAWAATPVDERTALLTKVAAALAERTDELADLITHEVGMPRTLSQIVQVGLPAGDLQLDGAGGRRLPLGGDLRQLAAWCASRSGWWVRSRRGTIRSTRSPPRSRRPSPPGARWCSSRARSRRSTPSCSPRSSTSSACLPGVFNLVTGYGPVVGEAIAAHPGVDMVSFTGSTRAGKRVLEVAAASVKRVALELGGKSANVILDDADLDKAVPDGLFKCYLNSGQTCSALTRMLVPRDRLAEVEERAVAAAETFTPGDPFDGSTRLGPLVSAVQRDRVRGYIDKGIGEGATLLTGGAEPPDGLEQGYFVRPTVFSNVTRDMTIAREEIFGPVLSIMPYDTVDEAVEIANDTEYGLAGGVWSGDAERATVDRPPPADRPGRGQRRQLQPDGALRRLQAVGHRARVRRDRARGVRRGQVAPALSARASPRGRLRTRTGPRSARCGSGPHRCRSSRR